MFRVIGLIQVLASPNLIRLGHRRRLWLAFLVLPLVGLFIQPPVSRARLQSAHSLNSSKHPESTYVPGEILLRFRQNATATKTRAKFHLSVSQAQGEISVHVERLAGPEVVEGLRLARVAPDDTWRAIEALRARPDVIYAEPNYILRSSAIPNDPHFAEMSNLKNTGQSGSPGSDIRAEQAWDITTGSDAVVVGVVDTGIDTEHPDLKDNIWRNSSEIPDNGVDDDNNGYVDDVSGWDFHNNDKTVFDSPALDAHGTHVAGTIGAVGNNGVGVVGVNWRVKLMPLKFLGSTDGTGTTAGAISALQYARTMRDRGVNIRVLNNSWGGRSFSNALRDAILEVNAAGILFVAAAGNEGMDNDSFPTYPANYDVPNIISVGAQGTNYDLILSSNFGDETVDIYAPGFGILSTTPRNFSNPDYTGPDGATYSFRTGTSMATPHVTGTAALVCAARPGILPSQLRNSILFGSYIVSSRSTRLETHTYLKANGALQSALENDAVPPGSIVDFRIAS